MIVNYNPIENNLDAFSRLRISQPQILLDSKQIVDNQPLIWDDAQTDGSGTSSVFLENKATTRMFVDNLTAGTRTRQTYKKFNYQAGICTLITLTGVLGPRLQGITTEIGYFDQNNGVFFQLSKGALNVVIRSSVSGTPIDSVINQNEWNIDRLDGTGPSEIVIDTSKTQILVIDFQWLGVGRVRFGVNIGGKLIYVHQFLHANILDTVWMSNPNLPVRYQISNDGTGPTAHMDHICASVISEGSSNKIGHIFTIDRGVFGLTTLNNTNIYPLLALRLKSTHLMANIEELSFSILCTSNCFYRYAVLLNPTIIGDDLLFSEISNSAIEAATSSTSATTLSGGILLASGYVDSSTGGNQNFFRDIIYDNMNIGANISGTSDVVVLAVQLLTNSVETFFGSLLYKEML